MRAASGRGEGDWLRVGAEMGREELSYLGIRGFDAILRGGIPRRAAVLLLSEEGPDRHLLGAYWVREGLRHGERVLVALGGESPGTFFSRLERMDVDIATSIASGALVVVDWYTGWTEPVEGVVEADRTLRASRKPEDLLAALDQALTLVAPGETRRAYLDVWPRALAEGDEGAADALLGSIRERLSRAGLTAIYTADRGLPEPRLAALGQEFHAILDARPEEEGLVAIAVLVVGGVPLTARYRRVRLSEDRAVLRGDRTVRTFSCPICGARVPFDATDCPGCGTSRAEMGRRAAPSGLMDYLESLGRPAPKEPRGRVATPPREPRAPGLTNGVRPPPGATNGQPPGRVNGVAPAGRTNGLRTPTGRTNGLVNGLGRARSGLTNGLTNGSGLTNGLGGPRARQESHRARWKLYLVPLLTAFLLLSPFLLPEGPSPARFAADGSFEEWAGVSGYIQSPEAGVNPDVALTAYKAARDGDTLYLYASVAGSWFGSSTNVHALYAFVDLDRDGSTGYRIHSLGADLSVVVEGSEGFATSATVRTFEGTDPHNWTAWRSVALVAARVSAGELEASVPLDPGTLDDPAILLVADDMGTGRSVSSVAFGTEHGALRAKVRASADLLTQGTPDALEVELESVGAPVVVTALDITVDGGASVVPAALPLSLAADETRTVTVKLDTSSVPPGTLITAELTDVVADRPVLRRGAPARMYVEQAPTGKAVDGWFGDWGVELTTDTDPPVALDADRDIDRFAANRTAGDLFLYVDVRGEIMAGWATPVRKLKSVPGGEPSSAPPVTPVRVVGEDVIRAYVDLDRAAPDGVPVLGLRGADLLLEVRGVQGEVTARTTYEWRSGWSPIAQPPVEHDDRRLEASLSVPLTGAIEVVFETSGWRRAGDVTEVSGTRGVRADADGVLRAEGAFGAAFAGDGRVELSAGGSTLAWTIPQPEALGFGPVEGWTMHPSPVGVRYSASGVAVQYSVSRHVLKEEIVLEAPRPGPLVLEFPLELGGDAMLWVRDGEPIAVHDGSRQAFEFAAPFSVDASGAHTTLPYELVGDRTYRITVPDAVLAHARFPLTIDPVVNYTLENDGSATDPGEQMGWSTAIGDFNGDGYADVLTGAPSNNLGGSLHGYVYIYYGPFSANDTTPDVWINGTETAGRFGYSLAAGNFNGDAYWDALVGRISLSGFCTCNVSIYHGSSSWSGLETTPDVNFEPPSDPRNFGWSVGRGNVDDADYDDVFIAETGRDNDGDTLSDGLVYLYLSPFASPVTSANFTLFPSSNASGQLGRGGIAVGKIDSDAYPDVVIGEPRANTLAGRVQVYKGVSFASGSGNRYPNATLSPPSAGGNSGEFGFAVSVGRVNGDAYADLAVGAPKKYSSDGRVYVYLANSDGTGLTTGASPSATLSSQSTAEEFGTSLAVVDFADDGTAGVFVGAPLADVGGADRGRAYWFDDPDLDTTVDETITGAQNGERLGQSVAGGRFGSDVRTVVAVGAYLWDDGATADRGRVLVATVPELPIPLLAVGVVLAVFVSRRRERRARCQQGRAPDTVK